ncbi:hypothetical protein Tco_0725080 [Tanacetum coccineum]|uniref:Uncharacterized protein n=1 Tax=Tanacetum coccineum TaxID=301880 RepID=A0ABQ4YBV3_9ASTR
MHLPKHHQPKILLHPKLTYIPISPTSSFHTNGYLNPPSFPPPRVSPPPPTQENASMDITLTLSSITPLDVQFDTPSPSPPIFGHPIPWNLLEAHVLNGKVVVQNVQGRQNRGQGNYARGAVVAGNGGA